MVRQQRSDFQNRQSGQGPGIFDTTRNDQVAGAAAGIGDGLQQFGQLKKKQEIEAGVSNALTFIEDEGQNVLDTIDNFTEADLEQLRFDEDDSNPLLERYLDSIDAQISEQDFDGAVAKRLEQQKAIAKSSVRKAINQKRNQFEIAAVDRKITDLKNRAIDASDDELELIFQEMDETYINLTGPLVDESQASQLRQQFRDDVYAFKADEALLDPERGFDEARDLAAEVKDASTREQLEKRIDIQERAWNQADLGLSFMEEIFAADMDDRIDLGDLQERLNSQKTALGDQYFTLKGQMRMVERSRQASAESLDLIRIERQVNRMLQAGKIGDAETYVTDRVPDGIDQERLLLKVDNARTEPIDFGAVADQITEMEGLRAGIMAGQFSSVKNFATVISDKVKTGALTNKQAFAMFDEYSDISARRQTAIQNNYDIMHGTAGDLSQNEVDQAFAQYLEQQSQAVGPQRLIDRARVQAQYATAAPKIPGQIRTLVDGSIYAEATPANMGSVKEAAGILNYMQRTMEGSHKAYEAFGSKAASMLNRFYADSEGIEDAGQLAEMWRQIQLAEHLKKPEVQAVIDATKQDEGVQQALDALDDQSYFWDEYALRGLGNAGIMPGEPDMLPGMRAAAALEFDRNMQIYDGNAPAALRQTSRTLFTHYKYGLTRVNGGVQWMPNAPEYHVRNVYADRALSSEESSNLYRGFIESKVSEMFRDVIDVSSGTPTEVRLPILREGQSDAQRMAVGMNPLGSLGLPSDEASLVRGITLKPVPGTEKDYQVYYRDTPLFTDLTEEEIKAGQLPYFTLQWEDFETYAHDHRRTAIEKEEAANQEIEDTKRDVGVRLRNDPAGITRETGL